MQIAAFSYERERLLPPPHLWIVNPFQEKLETPVDDRGLVVMPDLIRLVRATVDPSWDWSDPRVDPHHYYWHKAWYPIGQHKTKPDPAEFRDLSINKAYLPRGFHDWLHLVTRPPKRPSNEVMRYRIEAYSVTHSLFKAIKDRTKHNIFLSSTAGARYKRPVLKTDKPTEDQISIELMEEALVRHFEGYEKFFERAEKLPEDFRPFDPSEVKARPYATVVALQKTVTRNAVNLVPQVLAA